MKVCVTYSREELNWCSKSCESVNYAPTLIAFMTQNSVSYRSTHQQKTKQKARWTARTQTRTDVNETSRNAQPNSASCMSTVLCYGQRCQGWQNLTRRDCVRLPQCQEILQKAIAKRVARIPPIKLSKTAEHPFIHTVDACCWWHCCDLHQPLLPMLVTTLLMCRWMIAKTCQGPDVLSACMFTSIQ